MSASLTILWWGCLLSHAADSSPPAIFAGESVWTIVPPTAAQTNGAPEAIYMRTGPDGYAHCAAWLPYGDPAPGVSGFRYSAGLEAAWAAIYEAVDPNILNESGAHPVLVTPVAFAGWLVAGTSFICLPDSTPGPARLDDLALPNYVSPDGTITGSLRVPQYEPYPATLTMAGTTDALALTARWRTGETTVHRHLGSFITAATARAAKHGFDGSVFTPGAALGWLA